LADGHQGDERVIKTGADGIKEVTPPLSDADVEGLKAGDRVRITGVLYTARDAAHGRLWPLIEKGERLPIDVKGRSSTTRGPRPRDRVTWSDPSAPPRRAAWTSSRRRCSPPG
jgi:fumarate hydratase subunit beta